MLPAEADRLWTLNAVRVPDGVDEAAVRLHLLDEFNIEIGAGLGPLAGKIWRVGLMGASSSPRLILLLRGALESAFAKQRRPVHVQAGDQRVWLPTAAPRATAVRLTPRAKVGTARSVRRAALCASPASASRASPTAYLSLPDVRPLKTANPSTTAFIELRGARGDARRDSRCARMQRWVATTASRRSSSARCSWRKTRRSGQHEGVDFEQLAGIARGRLGARPLAARRQHDHAAAREEPVSLAVEEPGCAKLRELIIARRLEAELKKSRILELYLNEIEWGDGVYGVEAAARTYFHKSAAELDSERRRRCSPRAIINPRLLNPARPTPRLHQAPTAHPAPDGRGHPTSGVSST